MVKAIMATSFAKSFYYLLIIWPIIAFMAIIMCISLLIYHLYTFYKREIKKTTTNNTNNNNSSSNTIHRSKKEKGISYKFMQTLSILSMTAFTIAIIIATINHFICILSFDKLTPVFYQIAKGCIYCGFVMRLHHVYNRSQYGGTEITLRIYFIILILEYSSLAIYGYITMSHTKHNINNLQICHKSHSWIYLICSLTADTINTFICLRSYIRPLFKIMKSLRQRWNYTGKDFTYPAILVSILTSVATLVSVLGHILCILTDTYITFLIDMSINTLCVMLMTFYYLDVYDKLCCGLIKCVALFASDRNNGKTENEKVENESNNDKTDKEKRNKEKRLQRDSNKREETIMSGDSNKREVTIVESTKAGSKMEPTLDETRTINEMVSLKYEHQSEITRTIKQQRSM